MSKWIVERSEEATALLRPPLAPPTPTHVDVTGLPAAMVNARVPPDVADVLHSEVFALGAVDVSELSLHDWEQLHSWSKLRPLEVRRLLGVLRLRV